MSALFVVAFLGATGGQAFGLQPCPLHDALPGSHGAPADTGAGTDADGPRDASVHPGSASAQDHRHPHGPCTCVDDCQVGAADLGSIAGPGITDDFPTAPVLSGFARGHGTVLGPRHLLFELHLPNAPPRLL